jgi:hypothetical protein
MHTDESSEHPARAGGDRVFLADGVEWVARIEGQGVAGSDAIADRAIQILGFARAVEPERIISRTVCSLRSLDDLFESELAGLLALARPVSETRAEGGDGRGRRSRGIERRDGGSET